MVSKFILVWCLLYLEAHAGHSSQFQKSSDNSQCIPDATQKIYNVTDLLRCMNEFALDFPIQNNDRLLGQTSRSNSAAYKEAPYEFPYGNIILSLFNKVPSIFQDLSLNPTAGNYQSNYPSVPNESSNQFDGVGTNLFNALSSISRYDDLKCVPRILCEVASGKPPGGYKQAATGNDEQRYSVEFGRNIFAQLLAGSAEASPIFSFARAAVLGYGSNGNPAMCYRAFPRCPRNPDKLIHYLNNHNGGFFRFFSKGKYGNFPQSSYASRDKLESFEEEKKRRAPPPGIAGAEADRTGTGKLKFDLIDIPVWITREDYGKNFFPKDNTLDGYSRRVIFMEDEESSGDENNRSSKNRNVKILSDLEGSNTNIFVQDSIPFFPQESEETLGVRRLRFTPELSDSAPRNAFRFP